MQSSVLRPVTSSRIPGTSALRPGSSYRPGTGFRPKTGFQRLPKSSSVLKSADSDDSDSDEGSHLSVQRPLTKHGVAVVSSHRTDGTSHKRLGTGELAHRRVVDASDYESVLRTQQSAVQRETDKLRSQTKALKKLKRDREKMAKEKRTVEAVTHTLEGDLADLNLALDKMRSLFVGKSQHLAEMAHGSGADYGSDETDEDFIRMTDSDLMGAGSGRVRGSGQALSEEEKDALVGAMERNVSQLKAVANEYSDKCDQLFVEKSRLQSEIESIQSDVTEMEESVKRALFSEASADGFSGDSRDAIGDAVAGDDAYDACERYQELVEETHRLNEEMIQLKAVSREMKSKYMVVHNALGQMQQHSEESLEASESTPFGAGNALGGGLPQFVDIPVGVDASDGSGNEGDSIRIDLRAFDSKLAAHNLEESLLEQRSKKQELEEAIAEYRRCLELDDNADDAEHSQMLQSIKQKLLDDCSRDEAHIAHLQSEKIPTTQSTLRQLEERLSQKKSDARYMREVFMKDAHKYEALFEKEHKMQAYIDAFGPKLEGLLEEKSELEDDIVAITEHISEQISARKKKERREAGDGLGVDETETEASAESDGIDEQLRRKEAQKRSAEVTLKHTKAQLQLTKLQLSKVEALDTKIPLELENIEEQCVALECELQQLQAVDDWKSAVRAEFQKRRDALLKQKMRSFQAVDAQNEELRKVQAEYETFVTAMQQTTSGITSDGVEFMARMDAQIESVYGQMEDIQTEKEKCQTEASYHSKKKKALQLVSQINELLKEEATLLG